MSDEPPKITITGGRTYNWDQMPPSMAEQHNQLNAAGDALWNSDRAGAQAKWAEADRLIAPYEKKKEEEEKKKKPPPPTGPNPHPPEFVVDHNDAVAISTAPDVCRVGTTPTPFMSYALGGDDENYSPDVFSNGVAIKHNQSRIWYTRGDEPGTGLGVKSNTVSSKVIPNSHSSVVKVNGIWVQRHSDTCWLNNGNNPGEYTHVKSTEVNKAPDANDEHDKSAWQSFKDQLYDKSGTVQTADGIWDKAGEWWNDPSKIGTDATNFYNGLPTGSEVWQGTKNIGSGIANVGSQVWNDPKGSAGAAWDWGAGKASDGWEGAKDAWSKDGVPGVLGAGVGVAIDVVDPTRKLKLAKKVGEGLEAAADANKAGDKLPDKKSDKPPEKKAEEDGDGGARSTRVMDVECFEVPDNLKGKAAEYKRQLDEQMNYINERMTADDMAYAHWVLEKAQGTKLLRQPYLQQQHRAAYKRYLSGQGLSKEQIEAKTAGMAATHFLDMVAGGNPAVFSKDAAGNPVLGDSEVNSYIGNQWTQKGRAASLKEEAEHMRKEGRSGEKMKVNLRPCD
ncbi:MULTISPECIES: PAAR-like domain-containing protein [unclassified Bosea (in: a-proteobacteria)]|uniref:PAAR-like domain-containing protein n=1 Tax=unclassified Bosea (in: a-proteobacteria) TaxID=2653178 RepID=UPI0013DF7067|nr:MULTISPECIES: PAAR-like domain-containing protein [unclassified Bosea (in: a-proteobacteria)]